MRKAVRLLQMLILCVMPAAVTLLITAYPVQAASVQEQNVVQFEVDGNSYISLNLTSGELVIQGKRMMNDYSMDQLPEWYVYRNDIKRVTINGSLKRVGDYAFYGCENLTAVTLNSDLQEIGEGAFENCRKLSAISIGESVKSISSYAFYNCGSLERVEFHTGNHVLQIIESHAFALCGKLDYAVLPDSVVAIEDSAFLKCVNLKQIFPKENKISDIGIGAFAYCAALEELELNQLKTVQASAFYECAGIKKLILPKVQSIEEYAFWGCSSNSSVSLPQCVELGSYGFAENRQLTVIKFGNVISEIGENAFDNCTRLQSVQWDKSSKLKTIGQSAFHNCSSIEEIIIGENAEYIGDYAFTGCSKLEVIDVYAMHIRFGADICKDLVLTMYFYSGSSGIEEAEAQNIEYAYFTMISTTEFAVSYQTKWKYSGQQIKPAVTVKYKNNILAENEDYEVQYGANLFGTGMIRIKGKRSYCDSVEKYFTIEQTEQAISYEKQYIKSVFDSAFSVPINGIQEKAKCTYSVKNQKIATVSANGKVRLKGAAGKTSIVVKIDGTTHYKPVTIEIPLAVEKQKQKIETGAKKYQKYVTDASWNLNVKVKDNAKVTYSSSNKKIAVCDRKGNVKLRGKTGTVTITVKVKATGKYMAATQKIKISVRRLPTVKLTAYKTTSGFRMRWDSVKGAAKVKYTFKIKKWSDKWYSTDSVKSYRFRGGRIKSNLWVKIRVYDKRGRLIAQSKSVKAK